MWAWTMPEQNTVRPAGRRSCLGFFKNKHTNQHDQNHAHKPKNESWHVPGVLPVVSNFLFLLYYFQIENVIQLLKIEFHSFTMTAQLSDWNSNDWTEPDSHPGESQGYNSNCSYAKDTSLKANYSLKTQTQAKQVQLEEATVCRCRRYGSSSSGFKAGEQKRSLEITQTYR